MDNSSQQLLQHNNHPLPLELLHISPFVQELLFRFLRQDICFGLKELVSLTQIPIEFSLKATQEFEGDDQEEGSETGEEERE